MWGTEGAGAGVLAGQEPALPAVKQDTNARGVNDKQPPVSRLFQFRPRGYSNSGVERLGKKELGAHRCVQ